MTKREPIKMTFVREALYSRTPEWPSDYLEIVERFYVDQYGHEWHSFHSRRISESIEAPQNDKPPTTNEIDT